MKSKFGGNSKVKKSLLNSLRREFEVLAMKNDESITEYIARVMVVSNKMRSNGEDMADSKILERILRRLTEKFTRATNEGEDHVLKVDERSAMRGRGRGRSSYRGRGRGRGRSSFDKLTVECYNCHALGHFSYECLKWNNDANFGDSNEEDYMLLMTYEKVQNHPICNEWFLDSGCSNHMCGNYDTFSDIYDSFEHTVRLGNDYRMKVTGKSTIKLVINGNNYLISGVYYVPELKNNLLSIG
ncbi:uncharacterized protein [Rutidosis leptorrhynchoides]|uniref:uncharacterized protein n=1 Tax=Rutidosis leptorrhynchoides TaxID=125765 RepID=UPI003A9A3A1C